MSLIIKIEKVLNDPFCKEQYEFAKNHVDTAPYLESFTWEKAKYWDELITEFNIDKYEKFNNKMQYIANGASRVSIENLVNWLLRKSKEVGVEKAIKFLDNYNSSDTMTLYVIMTVMSIRPNNEYIFSNNVQLLNQNSIGKINKKLSQDLLLDPILSVIPMPYIASVFAFPVKKKILHTFDIDKNRKNTDEEYNIALEKINDVKDCLILSRGLLGVHTMAHKYLIPDDIPLVSTAKGSSWSFETFYLPTSTSPFITENELINADNLLKLYDELDLDLKKSLKVSIERLNGYCSSSNIIERSVNIRTCLESIFLDLNEKSEIGNTLALRVSRLMEKKLEDRKKVYKLVKDCYNITSKAVHRGYIPDKELKNIHKLDEVAVLARNAIVLKINNQKNFDWKDIELN